MVTDISFTQAAASLTLVVIVVAISLWRGLGLERSVLWAAVRATVQLLLVGVLFTIIFESSAAPVWAWLWVGIMVVVSGVVAMRRAPDIPKLLPTTFGAIALTLAVVLSVIFGLGIMSPEPVAIVVISGITIGNTMPSVVQAAVGMNDKIQDRIGQIEGMLALGFAGEPATRSISNEVTQLALIPQIERTKVVGLIALPGAMTGLLLAGTDPIDAVLIQLVVMLLVLGSVSLSVVVVSRRVAAQALTPDLRVADWVRRPKD